MERFDVAVIGGGAAGLSAAVVLGRARRTVVVVDAGAPRNAPAAGVHGFLTRDGMPPLELLAAGRKEVRQYGGVILDGEATAAERTADGFVVTLADGDPVTARRLLVTTGLVDELPEIPGVRERWGRDAVHCPYCHGFEFRDQAIGVLGTGPLSVHQAMLFRQLTPDLVLFAHADLELTAEQAEQLDARGIRVVPGPVAALDVVDDRLTGVRLADGTVVARQAVVVAPRFVARSAVLRSLGLSPAEHPFGEFVPAEPTGLTTVPGVWTAGNVTNLSAQVVTAASDGLAAGAAINADLVAEDTRAAVEQRRRLFTREFWDSRYESAHRLWSGNPNPTLVTTATDLAPASALDVGCGEGADAIWLARRGWRVTAVDVSPVALARAAEHATEAGPETAGRITWDPIDALSWDPAPDRYDLVTAHFLHLPEPARRTLYGRLAAAVRPGGTLLIVGHHPSDLDTGVHRLRLPDLMPTAEQIATVLDPAEWDISATAPERQTTDQEGRPVTIHDAVLRAVRLAV